MYCLVRYSDNDNMDTRSIYCQGIRASSIQNLSEFQITKITPTGINRFIGTPLTIRLLRFQRLVRWYLKTIHKITHPKTLALREQGVPIRQLLPQNPETQEPGIGDLFLRRKLLSRRLQKQANQQSPTNVDYDEV